MRVLAFDPGYERLGVAVLEKNKKEELIFSDCVCTDATLPFPARLYLIGEAAEGLIKKWKPDCVALEEVYFENNAKTAMQVAKVMGALSYIASAHRLPLHTYTPLQVKAAVAGSGRADKRAVALMVGKLIVLPAGKRLDDELDAIAVGITCLASVR
jgi:crossover junction endodeoxyribonuclease RuvC